MAKLIDIDEGDAFERRLNRRLREGEERISHMVQETWREQGRVMSDGSIEQALVRGELPDDWLLDWSTAHAKLVDQLADEWRREMLDGALVAGDAVAERQGTSSPIARMRARIQEWITRRGLWFREKLLVAQRRVMRGLLDLRDVLTGKLQSLFRSFVGLTEQGAASLRALIGALRQGLIDKTMPLRIFGKRIKDFVGRIWRERGRIIARNEIVASWNTGTMIQIWQSVDDGILPGYAPVGLPEDGSRPPVTPELPALLQPGSTVRRWKTRGDERVCPVCVALDGMVAPLDRPFATQFASHSFLAPPAHIRCRCTIGYAIYIGDRPDDKPLPIMRPPPRLPREPINLILPPRID